jgi:hypothetical protein
VLVARYYRVDHMANEILAHTSRAVPSAWVYLVKYVIPPTVSMLLVYNIADEAAQGGYGGYVWWGILCGWAMICVTAAAALCHVVRPPAELSSSVAPGL